MRRQILGTGVAALACVVANGATAQTFERSIELSKGKAKIALTAKPAARPSGPAKNPRVGISGAINASFSGFLARALDESGGVQVVPPSQLPASTAQMSAPMASMLRSELEAVVTQSCQRGKLDYVFLMDMGQPSMKSGFGASFGLGRMKWRFDQDVQLFDCKTRQGVWHQSLRLETSRSVFNMGLSGTMAGLTGSPEADQAMARAVAEKLTADMGW